MTIRNRIRNENLLIEQKKQSAVFLTTAKNEKNKSDINSGKTRATSANPPSSTLKENIKKKKPKVYKDIFNDEEIKNQNNFVSSSPISNSMQSK